MTLTLFLLFSPSSYLLQTKQDLDPDANASSSTIKFTINLDRSFHANPYKEMKMGQVQTWLK